jgi:hypothetical protein
MLDLESPHRIACKTVEILWKNSAAAFYDHALKLERIYSHLDVEFNGKILFGSLVHELLTVSERCCSMSRLEYFYSLIVKKWKSLWDRVASVHAASTVGISRFALELFQLAKYVSYHFANKIMSMGYKFPNCPTSARWLSDFARTSRVDCVLSSKNFELNPSTALSIFDFQTSKLDRLSTETISSQFAEYRGIQVCIYGLAYRNAGFSDVAVQMLCCDCGDISLIGVDVFLGEGEQIVAELSRMFQSGILGKKSMKKISNAINGPIAMVTLPDEVVEKS